MALKMMLISLCATFVAVSAHTLNSQDLEFDEGPFGYHDMEGEKGLPEPMGEGENMQQQMEQLNAMSEEFYYNGPGEVEEEDEYHEMLAEQMQSVNEMQSKADEENIAEVMISSPVERAEKVKKYIDLLFDSGNRPVTQGSTIALQRVCDKRTYLGCGNQKSCAKETCLGIGLYMEGSDYSTCKKIVFRIYHRKGDEAIRVGELVGLYYPPGHSWFSMAGGKGHTLNKRCPGKPTISNGFDNPAKWKVCWGEVFQIYARGKSNGDIIRENDDVMLFYPRAKKYVGVEEDVPANLRTCPGPTPPAVNKYDKCWGAVFEIWRK